MKNLTVVILTKNEEENIVGVVRNALQVTDKVLVVDSGSTDRTVELAEELGARVVFRAWDNDFAAQRNFALAHVATEWVLYLDADERMNDELAQAVRQAVMDNLSRQYTFMRRIQAFGFSYKHGIFKPDEVCRMFPAKEVRWEHKVHERPLCKLSKKRLSGYVEHYTYRSWQQWWEKAGSYTSIWAEDSFANGKRTTLGACFSHAAYGLLRAYFVQRGFLDGWGGLYSSLMHFMYTLVKYLKLYEIQNKEATKV